MDQERQPSDGWILPKDPAATRFGFARFLALTVVALIVAAIAVGLIVRSVYLGPGPGVADRIRSVQSPLVMDVLYRDPNPWEGQPGEVWVTLGHDTTQTEVDTFWCTVVVPAGGVEMYIRGNLMMWRQNQQSGETGHFTPTGGCP